MYLASPLFPVDMNSRFQNGIQLHFNQFECFNLARASWIQSAFALSFSRTMDYFWHCYAYICGFKLGFQWLDIPCAFEGQNWVFFTFIASLFVLLRHRSGFIFILDLFMAYHLFTFQVSHKVHIFKLNFFSTLTFFQSSLFSKTLLFKKKFLRKLIFDFKIHIFLIVFFKNTWLKSIHFWFHIFSQSGTWL